MNAKLTLIKMKGSKKILLMRGKTTAGKLQETARGRKLKRDLATK